MQIEGACSCCIHQSHHSTPPGPSSAAHSPNNANLLLLVVSISWQCESTLLFYIKPVPLPPLPYRSQHRSCSSPVCDGNQFQPSHQPNHPQSTPAQHRSNHGTLKWYVNFINTTISPIHISSYSLYTLSGPSSPETPQWHPSSSHQHGAPFVAPPRSSSLGRLSPTHTHAMPPPLQRHPIHNNPVAHSTSHTSVAVCNPSTINPSIPSNHHSLETQRSSRREHTAAFS